MVKNQKDADGDKFNIIKWLQHHKQPRVSIFFCIALRRLVHVAPHTMPDDNDDVDNNNDDDKQWQQRQHNIFDSLKQSQVKKKY